MMQLPFYQSLSEVRDDASQCQACGRSEMRSQVVMGSGDPDAALMLVAEYPSQSDDATGLPYSGPAGDYLDELLDAADIERSEIYITNLVRCYTTETGRPGDRIKPATKSEQRACSTWMTLETQFVRPQVILVLGAPVARALIDPEFDISRQRGEWHRRPDGVELIATFQPAYVLRIQSHDPDRAKQIEQLVQNDIRAAVERSRSTPPR
jgi:uracil-DNA glycosylase